MSHFLGNTGVKNSNPLCNLKVQPFVKMNAFQCPSHSSLGKEILIKSGVFCNLYVTLPLVHTYEFLG